MIALARMVLDVLFASLWQGALLAACVGLILTCLGTRANATTRCAAFQITLLAIACIPLATSTHVTVSHAIVTEASEAGSPGAAGATLGWIRRIVLPLGDREAAVLAALWGVGASAMILRVMLGVLQIRRVRRRGTFVTERDGVRVIASPDATVPMALGFFRPAVVVPRELATAGGARFECVVLHELAHIRRGDAWANLLERIAHAALFFNPVAAIVLRAIAAEREKACDDWAVARAPGIDVYARSLASVAVWNAGAGPLLGCGMSFGRSALARIERLQSAGRNGATTLSLKPLGGSTLMLVTIGFFIGTLAPGVAFEAQPRVRDIVSASSCSRQVRILSAAEPAVTGAQPHRKLATKVRVSVAASGAVTAASILQSSGSVAFDGEVEAAAKKSLYSAAKRDCQAVPGSYVFFAQMQS